MDRQLSLFPVPDIEKPMAELAAELEAYGWSFVRRYEETDIYQMRKGGNCSNFSRPTICNQLEKERLLAAGDWDGYCRYKPTHRI